MSTVPDWAFGAFTTLLIFIIGQVLLIYYGESFKNWTAQRSVEKMTKRIAEIKQEIEDARIPSQNLSTSMRAVYLLLHMVCLFLPFTIIVILVTQLILMSQFLLDFYKGLDSWMDKVTAVSLSLLFASLLFILFVIWRVFQSKNYESITQHLNNVYNFEEYEVKANQTIKHLEGRINRMQK